MKQVKQPVLVVRVGNHRAYEEGSFPKWRERIMKALGWVFYRRNEYGDIIHYSRPFKSWEHVTVTYEVPGWKKK